MAPSAEQLGARVGDVLWRALPRCPLQEFKVVEAPREIKEERGNRILGKRVVTRHELKCRRRLPAGLDSRVVPFNAKLNEWHGIVKVEDQVGRK